VAFNFSESTWVNFKLFGGVGFTMLFVFFQALYLTRHIVEKNIESSVSER
ncbi:MAG: hypothetical protein EBT30_09700, partial [Verrucomicrobia bacterium]|nr:hypothetical protein [Verrucomicrobiota bacterium]